MRTTRTCRHPIRLMHRITAVWTILFVGFLAWQAALDLRRCGAAADEEPAAPPPLTHYKGRTIAPTMTYHGADWLTRDSREREEHCQTLLKALKLKPDQSICDMGCGNGFYTLKMAKLVGKKGRILAVDVQPEMLHLLELRAKERRIENVEPIAGTLTDPRLPAGEIDMILCVDVYHEFSHPEQMLGAMRKALKPHGRLVLVEFRAEDPEVPILPLHKMTKAQVLAELEPNGFKLVESFDKLPWQHVLFFERDDVPAEESSSSRYRDTTQRAPRLVDLKNRKTIPAKLKDGKYEKLPHRLYQRWESMRNKWFFDITNGDGEFQTPPLGIIPISDIPGELAGGEKKTWYRLLHPNLPGQPVLKGWDQWQEMSGPGKPGPIRAIEFHNDEDGKPADKLKSALYYSIDEP